MKSLLRIVGGCLLLCAGSAHAQDRPDVPAVLQPRGERKDSGAVLANFRAAYAAAKRPRIAVLWNRSFSDKVAPTYDKNVEVTGKLEGSVTDKADGKVTRDRQVAVNQQYSVRSGQHAPEGPRSSDLTENENWRIETAAERPLINAGVQLVDRAMAMRTSPQGLGSDPGSNVQEVEASALMGKADYLVEVEITADAQSPTKHSFKVEVKRLSNSAVLDKFVSTGEGRDGGRPQYFANEHGFTAGPPTPDSIGESLGLELMTSLGAAFDRGAR